MNKKRVLVVGGAGYIGSYVNKMLNSLGYSTVVFDNLSRGVKTAVVAGEFFQGDIAHTEDLEAVLKRYSFDVVFNFAALTDVGESIFSPDKYYKNNVVDTINLLNALVRYDIKYFIFSSTAAIFGLPQSDKITESHPYRPINPYGTTKLMVESILADYEVAYGLKSCALRYFNAAGADPEGDIKWQKRKENNLIPLLLRSLLDEGSKSITLFGTDYPTPDGTCIRDYIHVHDLADAHIKAMEDLFGNQQSTRYNLGNAKGYSVLEVVKAVESVTGKKLSIEVGARRLGDPAILIADATKAQKALGWQPNYCTIEDMIAHTWSAMQNC